MAGGRGRGRKRLNSIIESYVPVEILEMILSRLSLKDNICASVVCKRWLSVAISVRKANKPPLLMQFPKSGDLFEFYDPDKRKSYYLELPKLVGSKIFYAKDGWLLCFKPKTRRVFLFSPYTKELIKFPKLLTNFQLLAFSAPPTSPDCVLFTVNHPQINNRIILVTTCRPGDSEWTSNQFQNLSIYVCSKWSKAVFCNGCFYTMSITNCVGVYNPEQHSWAVLPLYLPYYLNPSPQDIYWQKRRVMVEFNGDLYIIYPRQVNATEVYRLDLQDNNNLEKMEDLGGMAFFVNCLSSHVRTDLLGNLRDQIFFPKVLYYGKRCITYSLKDKRFYPRRLGFDLDEMEFYQNIWIDAPEDLSIFI